MKAYRVLVSNGDLSGDLLLSKIIEELRSLAPQELGRELEFIGLCGPRSESAGVKALYTSKEVAVVGIVEVLKRLPFLFKVLGRLGQELDQVDSVLCVDFPDFNLRLSELASKKKVPVDYIVAPQVWAWRASRVSQMRKLIRRLYPVLPFEEEFFRESGVDSRYLGHPLRDLLPPRNRRSAREEMGFGENDFVLCLMPGSRHSEIKVQLPLLLESFEKFIAEASEIPAFSRYRVRAVLPLASSWTAAMFDNYLSDAYQAKVEEWQDQGILQFSPDSHRAMMAADFGWITSGTATLEAAYYQLPHILIYKLKKLSAFFIRRLSQYFQDPEAKAGLPNILMNRMIIPELLQNDLTPKNLVLETKELLSNGSRLAQMKKDLRWIPKYLGEVGVAQRIALDLLKLWKAA